MNRRGSETIAELLQGRESILVGRSSTCDLVLEDLMVSRSHARIGKTAQGYYIEDLGSTNGTYVNGQITSGRTAINADTVIHIGLQELRINSPVKDLQKEPAIEANNIAVVYPNGYAGLQPLSLSIPMGQIVALMGPSGCGKSTLLKALNGAFPATQGEVYIHGLELKKNFHLLKRKIGYVPQDDIVHHELTVEQTLYYAAKIRLPNTTSNAEIKERIEKVLKDLNISDSKIRKNRVGELSGGQRKRVSIAVELLINPSILFLDEPTSPLDPETIADFLQCLQQLARQGTTIIMVTHKPEDLHFMDSVVFMGVKGYIAYYGDKDKLIQHFNKNTIIDVYATLSDAEGARFWNYKLTSRESKIDTNPAKTDTITKPKKESFFHQLKWLLLRYGNIKLADKSNIKLMLAQPILIAALIGIIFKDLKIGVLFLMAISAVWFGVSNASKEIVGELAIYRRERMYNLQISTYILSKLFVLAVIALIQSVLFVGIVHLFYMNKEIYLGGYMWQPTLMMFFLTLSASLLGLFISAVFSTVERVTTFVPIILLPQIMLAGVITKIDTPAIEAASYITYGRWGVEGLGRIQDKTFMDKQKVPEDSVESIMHIKPKFEFESDTNKAKPPMVVVTVTPKQSDEMEPFKTGAMRFLGFYKSDLMGLFPSLPKNILAIMILNSLFALGLIISLLRKKV